MKTIDFKDYEGKFIDRNQNLVINKQEMKKKVKLALLKGEQVENYAYATEPYHAFEGFSIFYELKSYIKHYFDDDVDIRFNFKNDKLELANKLIEEWALEQKDSDLIYDEINTRVDLGNLIKEIKKEME